MLASTDSGDPLCDRCGVRKAQVYPIAVMGTLTLSSRALCPACDVLETEAAIAAGPRPENDFTQFGPIDFGTLLETLGPAESEPPQVLAWYAARVREIASAHGQLLPSSVESFLKRWEAGDGAHPA